MNSLKKWLGVFWMILSPAIVVFMIVQAADKISKATDVTRANVTLQWSIILIIFFPICIGFLIFGYYGFKGYYDYPSTQSSEKTDY